MLYFSRKICIIPVFVFFTSVNPAVLFAQSLEVEGEEQTSPETDIPEKSTLDGRIAAGYSYSYFNRVSALRQQNSVLWRKGKNSLRGFNIISGGMGSMQGKFNAFFSGSADHYFTNWIEGFLFSTYDANAVTNMQGKLIVGGGLKTVIIRSKLFLFDFYATHRDN